MDHEEILENLGEHRDGVLPPEEALKVDRHLTDCDTCRGSDEAYRSLFAPLRVEPRAGFSGRVLARLDEKTGVSAWTWRRLALPAMGALAMLVMFFSAFHMPDPAWADADRSLSSIAYSQWADVGTIQPLSISVEDFRE